MKNKIKYLEMTQRELLNLGFRVWNQTGLVLIPINILQKVLANLPKGTELISIRGKKGIVGKDTFDDALISGLTIWGWIPKNKRRIK